MQFDRTLYDYAKDNHVHCGYGFHEAYKVCQKFEDRYVQQLGKPLSIVDPDWAYWFAKFIINDHWPAGELLICQNPDLASAYRIMVNFSITAGILGHSKDGIKTAEESIVLPKKREKINLEEVADFVDAEMEKFRRQSRVSKQELRELL